MIKPHGLSNSLFQYNQYIAHKGLTMIEKCEICGQVGNEVKIVDPTEPTGIKTLPNPCKWNNESHAWICEDCAYECRDDIVTAVNEQRCERANVQIEAGKYAYACGYYD